MTYTDHIYAGAAATLATHRLLSLNQRELLLNTKHADALRDAVRETFFAPYMHTSVTLPNALDDALLHTKEYVSRIDPAGNVVQIFFLRHDYANVAHILTAITTQRSEDEALSACSKFGMYAPALLFALTQQGTLRNVDERLGIAVHALQKNRRANNEGSAVRGNVHTQLERAYLQHARETAKQAQDKILIQYVSLQIDMRNIRFALRTSDTDSYVEGGYIEKRHLHTDGIATALASRDGSFPWKQLVTEYIANGDFTAIEKTLDDFHTKQLKRMAIAQDTLAPVFLYLHTVIENIQYIRSIHTAHTVGLSSDMLRAIIRIPSHAYGY
jgi:vacuolar-type H+-ATPase subunit C/Vma6